MGRGVVTTLIYFWECGLHSISQMTCHMFPAHGRAGMLQIAYLQIWSAAVTYYTCSQACVKFYKITKCVHEEQETSSNQLCQWLLHLWLCVHTVYSIPMCNFYIHSNRVWLMPVFVSLYLIWLFVLVSLCSVWIEQFAQSTVCFCNSDKSWKGWGFWK